MTEKIRGLWERLPAWWPVGVGIIYLIWSSATWHQEMNDRMKSVETQVIAIQEYLRTEHKKIAPGATDPGVSELFQGLTKNTHQQENTINTPHL